MIFRAIFGLGLVALLAPRTPEPGTAPAIPASVTSWADVSHRSCESGKEACADKRTLGDVKAEIDASIKARGGLSYSL